MLNSQGLPYLQGPRDMTIASRSSSQKLPDLAAHICTLNRLAVPSVANNAICCTHNATMHSVASNAFHGLLSRWAPCIAPCALLLHAVSLFLGG